jgi:hypothetical protein
MEQWLVRTAKNWIAGPYTKDQVCKMILGGQLSLHDEVCSANGYWIFIHERNEVRDQLGIEVPKQPSTEGDETTETQKPYKDDDDPTDPEIANPRSKLSELPESTTEHTAVLDASVFHTKSQGIHRPSKPFPSVEVKGHSLKMINWQKTGLLLLLLLGSLAGTVFLLRFKK